MKRLLAILFSLVMAFSLVTVSALAAENTPTVTVETAANAVDAGSEVSLKVSIKDNTGFTNYEWSIRYDKARLELQRIEANNVTANPNDKNTGYGSVTTALATPKTGDGVLFTLVFKVKDNAETGFAKVKIVSNNFKNIRSEISAAYVDGGVTVNGTTGGPTTGGGSTGGPTTGGGSTGGPTTGGGSTGGPTTGGGSTGGPTTGGGSTGGGETGGGSTGGSVIIITPETSSPLFLSGANQVVAPGSAATFRIDKEFKDLQSVAVDGVTLDKSNYAAWSGSTYIKLLPSYMKTLSAGTHTLSAYFSGATAVTTFTISADGVKNPSTGANDVVGVAVAMAVISLLGASAVICKK